MARTSAALGDALGGGSTPWALALMAAGLWGCSAEDLVVREVGAAGAAGSGLGGAAGWCAQQSIDALYCEDFEGGRPVDALGYYATASGSCALTATGASSSPTALRCTVEPSTENPFALVGVGLPEVTTGVSAAVDLLVEAVSPNGNLLALQLLFGAEPYYKLPLFLVEDGSGGLTPLLKEERLDGATQSLQVPAVLQLQQWHRVELRVALDQKTLTVLLDGLPQGQPMPLSPDPQGSELTVQYGINWLEAGRSAALQTDALLVQGI